MSVEDLNPTLELLEKFKAASIISSACELEVFDKISSSGPISSDSLAEKYDWNKDCCGRMLDALVALEYLTKNKDGDIALYSNTNRSQFLIRRNDPTIWDMTQMTKKMFNLSIRMADEVKTGSHKQDAFPRQVTMPDPNKPHEGQEHDHGHHHHCKSDGAEAMLERYRAYDGLAALYAPGLVTVFDLSSFTSAVDLGGGSGVMSRELARANPSMDITLFDLPHIVKMVKDKFLPPELQNIHVMGGNFLETDLPSADLYLLSKIIHDWQADQVDTLLSKVYDSINTGGGIILMEKCLNDDKDGPYTATNWDMLVMSHCAGNLRSGREYTELLEKHKFTDVKIHKTDPLCSYDVIFARKI